MAELGPFDIRRLRVDPVRPLAAAELPKIVVAMATLDGRDRLVGSLAALARADYPAERLGIAITDNGSRDGTVAWLAREHPRVRVVQNARNQGFAGPSNRAAELGRDFGPSFGRAEVIVFLNNDVEIEPSCLRELVAPIVRGRAAATGAQLTSWDGKRLDHAGGGTNFQGIAIAHGWQEAPGPDYDWPRKCLFPSGGAMAIDARVLEEVGGFDEEYFAYYEDLDLGWRLWLAGHEVHYVPTAIGRHKHSGTSTLFPPETLRLLQARNPLLTAFKNYERENLDRMLPALLALAVRRTWVMARNPDVLDFRMESTRPRRPGFWSSVTERLLRRRSGWRLERMAAADFIGLNDLLGNWDHWMARRAAVQALRRRPDAEIFELFLKPLWCVEGEPGYIELQRGLARHFGLDELFAPVTIAGPDPHK